MAGLVRDYPLCSEYIAAVGQILNLASVCVVAIVNVVMSIAITALANLEMHDCYSEKQTSIMLGAFVARFINTAFVILLVQASGLPGSALEAGGYATESREATPVDILPGVFKGQFTDFTVEWYAASGFTVSFQMLTNLFEPHISGIVKYCIFTVRKWFSRATMASNPL